MSEMIEKAMKLARYTEELAVGPDWGVDDQDVLEWLIVRAKILEWFYDGNVGESSKAIAAKVAGIDGPTAHPYDPSDLRRCMEFLDRIPEAKGRLMEMREVSPNWYRLVGCWDKLTATFKREMGEREDGRAPETYKMMKAVLER